MSLYVNAVLSDHDCGFFRVGGPGLANCMFVAARAAILSTKLNVAMLRPTWERVGIGQWLRKERDKRFYSGLFAKKTLCADLHKFFLLKTKPKISEGDATNASSGIIMVEGLNGYFADLWEDAIIVRKYFEDNICGEISKSVPRNMGDAIAVHVRLGDYPAYLRTDIGWYADAICAVQASCAYGKRLTFKVFSDGRDDELAQLLTLPGVERACYGNALADILAISRCKMLIGSDSTFSGWGAFLGDVPCMFAHLHYGRPLQDHGKVLISVDKEELKKWATRSLSGIRQ